MVESLGMQQVLQLSSMASRTQMAQQGQAGEVARAFDKELAKLTDREADQAHQIDKTPAEMQVKEEGSRKPRARLATEEAEEKEEEEKEEQSPPAETDQGNIINLVA